MEKYKIKDWHLFIVSIFAIIIGFFIGYLYYDIKVLAKATEKYNQIPPKIKYVDTCASYNKTQ